MPKAAELAPQIEQFLHDNPQGVLTSFRRNGLPQLSIVTVYPREGGVGISITETRIKFKNLLRDPRCSVLVSHVDWWSGFLVFEGKAELTHSGNSDPEKLRKARRHIFSATTRRRSADWDEYDRIANEDKRVAMLLRPDHVLHGVDEFLGQAAVGNQDHADHWELQLTRCGLAQKAPEGARSKFGQVTAGAALRSFRQRATRDCDGGQWAKSPLRARPGRSFRRRTPSGAVRRCTRTRC